LAVPPPPITMETPMDLVSRSGGVVVFWSPHTQHVTPPDRKARSIGVFVVMGGGGTANRDGNHDGSGFPLGRFSDLPDRLTGYMWVFPLVRLFSDCCGATFTRDGVVLSCTGLHPCIRGLRLFLHTLVDVRSTGAPHRYLWPFEAFPCEAGVLGLHKTAVLHKALS
jgi:hypothetical protein